MELFSFPEPKSLTFTLTLKAQKADSASLHDDENLRSSENLPGPFRLHRLIRSLLADAALISKLWDSSWPPTARAGFPIFANKGRARRPAKKGHEKGKEQTHRPARKGGRRRWQSFDPLDIASRCHGGRRGEKKLSRGIFPRLKKKKMRKVELDGRKEPRPLFGKQASL